MLTLVCMLASCRNDASTPPTSTHTHNYGEWEIAKIATCTEEGSKERYCSCGEKQTAVIGLKSTNMGNGALLKKQRLLKTAKKSIVVSVVKLKPAS